MSKNVPTASAGESFPPLARRFSVAILLLVALVGVARAQTTSRASDGSTPLALSPGAPAGSYSVGGFDNVNLYNGSLNFALPLVQVGGRGGAQHASVLTVERHWLVEHYEDEEGNFSNFPVDQDGGGLYHPGYGPGTMTIRRAGVSPIACPTPAPPVVEEDPRFRYQSTLTTLGFVGPGGTEIEFRSVAGGGVAQTNTSCGFIKDGFNRVRVFAAADGSGATFVSDWDIIDGNLTWHSGLDPVVDGYLYFKDGTAYRIDYGRVSWMRDRNGNRLTFEYASSTSGRLLAVTDSLGRRVTFAYDVNEGGPYGVCDRITYKGFGGAERVVRVSKTSLGGALRAGYSLTSHAYLFPGLQGSPYVNYNPTVVSSVWLPDGVRRYQLQYNSHGELARVVLPTGGAFEYDFGAGTVNNNNNGVLSSFHSQIYRRLLERRVYADGVSLTSRTTYSRPETEGGGGVTNEGFVNVTQEDASGSVLAASRHHFHGPGAASTLQKEPIELTDWQPGKEYRTEVLDANETTVLRSTVQTWAAGGGPYVNPRVTEKLMTTEPTGANKVSKQSFAYDQYNNQIDVSDYDYGTGAPGPLIRRTHTEYLTTHLVSGTDYTAQGIHLRGLPVRTSLYDAADTEQARTTFEYDNYGAEANHAALVGRGGISGLDAAFNTLYHARGNATEVKRYLLTAGAVTGSVSTYQQYDVAGNVVKVIDARGFQATLDFGDRFGSPDGEARSNTPPTQLEGQTSYAFATSATNALGHTSYTQFDYYLGRPLDAEDINGAISTGFYADALDRPTQLISAHGTDAQSQSSFAYDDAGRAVTATADLNAFGDNLLKCESLYDQLGRTFETRQYETAVNYIAVRRAYDVLGRANQISNPFRPWQSETPVWTTTQFDAQGRTTRVTTPDGAYATTAYSGNQVTATDQIGRSRRSLSDALGRLSQVIEDPNGAAYATDYTYDVQGNLRRVSQDVQNRYFMYDSLSRLVRAKHPEQVANGNLPPLSDPLTGHSQWSEAYTYDDAGNLLTLTDARGVTITSAYDALSRPVTSDYSDTGVNPDVRRYYDGAANGKGRFWHHYAGGDFTSGSNVEHTAVDAYDAAGRPLLMRQLFKYNGAWNHNYQVQRTYDRAGNVLSQTYPSGRAVTYQYDAAGRLNDLRGNLGDAVQRVYSTGLQYTPSNQLRQEQFGTQTPVYNKLSYNVRRQLSQIRVGTTPDDDFWNRGAIINHYSDQTWAGSGGDNNGALKKQDVYIPNDEQISGYSLTYQFYSYDGLNRLQSVREARDGVNQWEQIYAYDRYGNRQVNAASWGGAPEPQFAVNVATNRLGVPAGYGGAMTYDAAGNLIGDTYTGGGARAYDAAGKMTEARDGANQLVGRYAYDADGMRTRRTEGGQEVWQVYGMGGELLAEYAADTSPSAPRKEYGYRGGTLLVTAGMTSTVSLGNFGFESPAVGGGAFQYSPSGGGWAFVGGAGVSGNSSAFTSGNPPAPEGAQVAFVQGGSGSSFSQSVSGFQAGANYAVQFKAAQRGNCCGGGGQDFDVYLDSTLLGTFRPSGAGYEHMATASFTTTAGAHTLKFVGRSSSPGDNTAFIDDVRVTGGDGVRWLVSDQLGTPRMILDEAGSLSGVRRHDYLPFGEELWAGMGGRTGGQGYAADGLRQRFTGYEKDAETGLDYAQARYYSGPQGRFTSPDPFAGSMSLTDPQSFNRYAYVSNDPVNFSDPSGLAGGYAAMRSMSTQDIINSFTSRSNNSDVAEAYAEYEGRLAETYEAVEQMDTLNEQLKKGATTEAQAREKIKDNPMLQVVSPKVKNATPQQASRIASGHAEAGRRMQTGPCAALFGGAEKGLKTLNKLTFTIDPNINGDAEVDGNKVSVKPNGLLLTPDDTSATITLIEPTGPSSVRLYQLSLPGLEARAFGISHEAGHPGKVFGDTDKDGGSREKSFINNWKIWKGCYSDFTLEPLRLPPVSPRF